MRINPFLTSLPQVMILVTLMILPMKLFGLRLPEVCAQWPMSLMGSCTLQETTCTNFIPKNLKFPGPKPAPKPRAKASSNAFSSGEHVQLFRMVHDRGGGGIEVRNFPQFSAISQFFAIFRNFSQFSAIFRNFSAIFLTSRFSDCLPTLVQNREKNFFLLCLHVCTFAFSHSVGHFESGSTN